MKEPPEAPLESDAKVSLKQVSVESSVTAKETKNIQGIGPSSTFGTQSAAAKRGVHFAKIPF